MAGWNLTVDLKGFDEISEKFKHSPQIINEATKQMLTKATLIAMGKAKENSPIDKGMLRGSIQSRVEGEGQEMVGIVGTNVEYAKWQEFGTGTYAGRGYITPKRARMLAWQDKSGQWIFARAVRGVPAKKYMLSGLEEVKAKMNEIIKLGVEVIQRQL